MALQVTISGVDVTKKILKTSFRIENVLTRQVDRCTFTIEKTASAPLTYRPTIGREVIVYNGATKIFAGNIVRVTQKATDYKIILYDIECNDYGRRLDRYLISDTFTNTTIEDIIESIVLDKNLDAEGFTTTYVSAPKILTYVAFNYETFSSILTQLADLVNYDWYVDYDKNIHFFAKDVNPAPFSVTDDNGNLIFNTLQFKQDNTQLRNVIYVRGGEYLGSNFTSEYVSDGIQNVYPLPYRYDNIQLSVTGDVFNGGMDGVDIAENYDYMWNKDEKFVRFRGDRIPSNTSQIRISGEPFLPVRVKLRDPASIADTASAEGGDGIYEYLIIDQTINSKEAARDRARAEIQSYSETINDGEFSTYTDGLRAGQQITVTSAAHEIDQEFIINKVVVSTFANALKYQVTLMTTKTLGIIDFLRNLLDKDKKDIIINENEILDLVEAFDEPITISESVSYLLSHNPQTETVTVGESVTIQAINYAVSFVLGDMSPPVSTKRLFLLDQSPMS